MSNHAYQDATEDIVTSYKRIHGNSEQTAVYVLSVGEEWYLSVACDVDPVDADPGQAELIGYAPTIDGIHKRTERWLETHARGVGAEDSGDGLLSRFVAWAQDFEVNQPEDDTNA
jgi:hypothetical protein